MLRLSVLLSVFLCVAVGFSVAQTPTQPPIWASKPDVSAFEKIVKDRLASAQSSIDQVTSIKGSRTIQNTLVPFDEAVRQINAAGYLSGLMQQVHPDTAFRDKATDMVRLSSAAQTALALNHEVYQAVAGLDLSHADAATQY